MYARFRTMDFHLLLVIPVGQLVAQLVVLNDRIGMFDAERQVIVIGHALQVMAKGVRTIHGAADLFDGTFDVDIFCLSTQIEHPR